MSDKQQKTIGIFLPDGFADWEYGLLAAGAAEHLGARIVFITAGAKPVRSIGGLVTKGERDTSLASNQDLDAIALIGSDIWQGPDAPEISDLVRSVLKKGGVAGAICGATVAMARAGLLSGIVHTSNGREWLEQVTAGYEGEGDYVESAAAVTGGRIVTASGLAPDTFATQFLLQVYPESADMLDGVKSMFAAEHAS